MNKAFYSYQPSDLEDELFLSDIPLDVLTSSIRSQFEHPLEYRKKDYVQSFITKYEYTVEELEEAGEEFNLEAYHDQFIAFMENIMQEYLNVGFVDIENKSEDIQHEILHLTYRFFIKNIKRNFVSIIINYIDENRDDIMSSNLRKKDVTALNFKLEIDNDFDVIVLSNLKDIVDRALEDIRDSYDVDDFFHMCETNEYVLELQYIKKAYDEYLITGNFIEKYLDMIDDAFRVEIEGKIRNVILRRYPKRTVNIEQRKKKLDEEFDEEEGDTTEDQ